MWHGGNFVRDEMVGTNVCEKREPEFTQLSQNLALLGDSLR